MRRRGSIPCATAPEHLPTGRRSRRHDVPQTRRRGWLVLLLVGLSGIMWDRPSPGYTWEQPTSQAHVVLQDGLLSVWLVVAPIQTPGGYRPAYHRSSPCGPQLHETRTTCRAYTTTQGRACR